MKSLGNIFANWNSLRFAVVSGTISTKSLQMVIMQHASFLYCQRTLRGLRSTIKTATASTTSRCALSSTQVSQHLSLSEDTSANQPSFRLFGTPQSCTLYFIVEAKSRAREVYAQTCHHFSRQGMLDTELFGLAVLIGELSLRRSYKLLFRVCLSRLRRNNIKLKTP